MSQTLNVNNIEITWLGQSGFKIKGEGKIIYIDPYKVQDEEKADLIFVTHEHYDHCDPDSIEHLEKEDTIVIAPSSCSGKIKENLKTVGQGMHFSEKGLEINVVAAYNKGKPFHPQGKGVGYLLTFGDKTIYHAGDTDLIPEMERLGGVDVALLPIGGTYTMDVDEAVNAVKIIKPGIVIPMHYGEVVGSSEDAQRFKKKIGKLAQVEILE